MTLVSKRENVLCQYFRIVMSIVLLWVWTLMPRNSNLSVVQKSDVKPVLTQKSSIESANFLTLSDTMMSHTF